MKSTMRNQLYNLLIWPFFMLMMVCSSHRVPDCNQVYYEERPEEVEFGVREKWERRFSQIYAFTKVDTALDCSNSYLYINNYIDDIQRISLASGKTEVAYRLDSLETIPINKDVTIDFSEGYIFYSSGAYLLVFDSLLRLIMKPVPDSIAPLLEPYYSFSWDYAHKEKTVEISLFVAYYHRATPDTTLLRYELQK